MFDHKGDYRVEDLIRNGAASAQVRVAIVSSQDQRTYEVQRCTRSGYTLYDPQLGEKLGYTRIKEEVLPWLRGHLGVHREPIWQNYLPTRSAFRRAHLPPTFCNLPKSVNRFLTPFSKSKNIARSTSKC
ncbi:MAG: hypothetical protein HC936_11755 [Leptolyngbyaceae cyanobacterium SU_3_3]|nr:hypothetical protein [Leptolyngbyaceae cyanobacterium SU_3_3]